MPDLNLDEIERRCEKIPEEPWTSAVFRTIWK